MGPDADVAAGEKFESFRVYDLLLDTTGERRDGAAACIARCAVDSGKSIDVHKTNSNPATIRRVTMEQAHEVGFEMVIMSFGSGFNF